MAQQYEILNRLRSLLKAQIAAGPAPSIDPNENAFRCVPQQPRARSPVWTKEVKKKQMREAKELANAEQIRFQSKQYNDDLQFYKRKLQFQTELPNPAICARAIPGRSFDKDFVELFHDSNIGAHHRVMKKVMLGHNGSKTANISASGFNTLDNTPFRKSSHNHPSDTPNLQKSGPLHQQFFAKSGSVRITRKTSIANQSSQSQAHSRGHSAAKRDKSLASFVDDLAKECKAEDHTDSKQPRRNLVGPVLKEFREVQKAKLIKRISQSHMNEHSKKRTVLGSTTIVHEKNLLNSAVSEDERARLSMFMGNKWINELAFPNGERDCYGQKIITEAVNYAIERKIHKLQLRQTLDKSLRFQFYQKDVNYVNFKYSKDYEINTIFKRMHKKMVALDDINTIRQRVLDFEYTEFPEEEAIIYQKQKIEEPIKKMVSLILKDLTKEFLPGILNYELAYNVARRFILAIQPQNYVQRHKASKVWKRCIHNLEMVIS